MVAGPPRTRDPYQWICHVVECVPWRVQAGGLDLQRSNCSHRWPRFWKIALELVIRLAPIFGGVHRMVGPNRWPGNPIVEIPSTTSTRPESMGDKLQRNVTD